MVENAAASGNAYVRPLAFGTPPASASTAFYYWLYTNGTNYNDDYSRLHFDGGNLLFCDGHVKWKKQSNTCASDFGLTNVSGNPVCGASSGGGSATIDPAQIG